MKSAIAKVISVDKQKETEAGSGPEQQLIQELSQIRRDRRLVIQIARIVSLSRDLRARRYSGQVTLHFGSGLVNSVRQEEITDWGDWQAS